MRHQQVIACFLHMYVQKKLCMNFDGQVGKPETNLLLGLVYIFYALMICLIIHSSEFTQLFLSILPFVDHWTFP